MVEVRVRYILDRTDQLTAYTTTYSPNAVSKVIYTVFLALHVRFAQFTNYCFLLLSYSLLPPPPSLTLSFTLLHAFTCRFINQPPSTMNTTPLNTKMSTSNLAAEKDLQSPTGHPALASDSDSQCTTPTTPLEYNGIKAAPARYYAQPSIVQDLDVAKDATPGGVNAETATEFEWRNASPERVKEEPTILDKVKDVLHIRRRS